MKFGFSLPNITPFLALLRHELALYRITPGTWVFLALAVGMSGLTTFYMGHLFAGNQATLEPFFAYLPWILAFFTPPLVMGVWVAEWRQRTMERLVTLPVSLFHLALTKTLAAWIVLGVFLALTTPLIWLVSSLGTPDFGPILTGYIGSLLLAGVFAAVCSFCSVLSRSYASGVSLGFVLLVTLLSLGLGGLTAFLRGIFPSSVVDSFAWASFLERYQHFVSGLVDLRDVVFFLFFIVLFFVLGLGALTLRLGRLRRPLALRLLLPVFLAAGLLAAVQPLFWRFDATEERLHTLEDATRRFLHTLQQDVTFTLYISEQTPDFPSAALRHAARVKDFLEMLRAQNPEHVFVRVIDPESSLAAEQKALQTGIQPVQMQTGERYYFGLALETADRSAVLPVLNSSRAAFLEFDVLSGLHEVFKTKRKTIALVTNLDLGLQQGTSTSSLVSELSRAYTVVPIKESDGTVPADTDLVLVLTAPFIRQENVYAIDQYVVNGGRAIFVLDPFLRTAPSDQFLAPDRNADALALDHPADLLRAWGVEYHFDRLVGDKVHAPAVTVQEAAGPLRYPLWLKLGEGNINPHLPVTMNVKDMLLLEPGFFEKKALPPAVTYEPVLWTYGTAQTVDRTAFEKNSVQTVAERLEGTGAVRDLAGLLVGPLPSAFADIPPAVHASAAAASRTLPPHVAHKAATSAVMFVGDADFLSDKYALSFEQDGERTVAHPSNDNIVFMFNAVQYMMGDTALLTLRGKKEKPRPFTVIEDLLASASAGYADEEQRLTRALYVSTRHMDELRDMMKDPAKQQAPLQKMMETEARAQLDIRAQLRDLRRQLNRGVDAMGWRIAAVGILAVPFLLAIGGGLMFAARRRRAKR